MNKVKEINDVNELAKLLKENGLEAIPDLEEKLVRVGDSVVRLPVVVEEACNVVVEVGPGCKDDDGIFMYEFGVLKGRIGVTGVDRYEVECKEGKRVRLRYHLDLGEDTIVYEYQIPAKKDAKIKRRLIICREKSK